MGKLVSTKFGGGWCHFVDLHWTIPMAFGWMIINWNRLGIILGLSNINSHLNWICCVFKIDCKN